MVKWGLKELYWIKYLSSCAIIACQIYLIHKYNIAWYDWLIWGVLCVGYLTFIRILTMTEAIVETIKREHYYETIKKMLFTNDKRNTDD